MGPWTTYAVPWIIYREPWTSNIGNPGPLIGYPGQNGIGVPGKGVPKYNPNFMGKKCENMTNFDEKYENCDKNKFCGKG